MVNGAGGRPFPNTKVMGLLINPTNPIRHRTLSSLCPILKPKCLTL
jgi:hypothetical protein